MEGQCLAQSATIKPLVNFSSNDCLVLSKNQQMEQSTLALLKKYRKA